MDLPPRVREVLDRLEETRGLYYNVARPTASLLFFLARLLKPREIVEVGTANGYSAILFGAALQPFGGRVVTIERDGRLVMEARRNITDAGLQDVVTVFPGSAYKILPRFSDPFAFVFLDATKQEYLGYLDRIRPRLAPGAVVAADNLLSHHDELRAFTRAMLTDSFFTSTIVPVGLGILLAVFEQLSEKQEAHVPSSMGELIASAAPRIFRGTVAEVRSGAIFKMPSPHAHLISPSVADLTLDGYEQALAEEAKRLPAR